ncbi:bifunctional alpha,alpha-trehalose-phosphate synthase (UDP-forming)/trehalose-phosphatase [Anaeromyxobacter oryzae]|uniref:Bifunctional alpha,alpha-trehalose-phosphate synthase (UDP-forming)/trehalose-phosphatase n=1 Tax=Anaeromyxobacter oryzae TaxID=2918170 RepID=A0ABM7WVS7_9BACT|nr:bifunctional alpha,alpha-trehalose-phosphate synthase (UDP-forming)/trehalose-phosphatase [Anaeromyxobacter oryzae]BDG03607.1 bifunctional alpha,alpha-trehalose-phosphate synthase (UDP-forming)/trehalose-phosphatase [Anaeromyxobacter oryzae]
MARLLIASNRLPVTVHAADGALSVERSSGGLATGMKGPHERLGGLWIGWPGDLDGLDARQRAEVDRQLDALRLSPVQLSRDEIARYYEGYSNAVLWPLFHYETARLPPEVKDFDAYQAVNERFADAIAARHEPGDLVWIHDYQLMLVPQLLRDRIPDARIGFFLHIPFPSSEIFRILPDRERILEGLLGADLLGFHTATFVRHFASSALRLLGLPTDVDRIRLGAREVILGVFPMGVDAAQLGAVAASEKVQRLADETRAGAERLLVAIDRLDYTKGIPRRLLAFDALLRAHPELRGTIRLVQVAVPSRENVEAYAEYRAEVDALVGRIHGEYATPRWSPIHYLHRSLSQDEIVALYRAADAVLVTPLRDGMNLVAKEFVASRSDGDGVLVLSEFAGAAAELAEAVLVNPFDVERTAAALHRALDMPEEERRTRMAALRERVLGYDVHAWARAFVSRLERTRPSVPADLAPSPAAALRAAIDRAASAPRLALLLDYDGTLVPFATTPELAAPDAELLSLLRRLAARPRTEVHLVSGRPRRTMERWFGPLDVGLHAEHGVWSRFPGAAWEGAPLPDMPWRDSVRAILREFAERTPGSLVEEKTAGFAWHYRGADPEYGAAQAKDLSLHLSTVLSNVPVELLPGDKVVEIRVHGIHKGRIATEVARRSPEGTLLLAMGDDRTDEDLFAGLPGGSVAIHVGPAPSRAPLRIPDVRAARRLLAALADAR